MTWPGTNVPRDDLVRTANDSAFYRVNHDTSHLQGSIIVGLTTGAAKEACRGEEGDASGIVT